jgi:Uma2 family endonuclease
LLAVYLSTILQAFIGPRKIGLVTGADGMMRLFPNLVRMPDVAFTSWSRLPDGKIPTEQAPQLAPDLAIEILSPSNTKKEMNRKRGEYFEAGVRLVWIFHLDTRTVDVYTSAGQPDSVIGVGDMLNGRDVLPGFEHSVGDIFACLDDRITPQS